MVTNMRSDYFGVYKNNEYLHSITLDQLKDYFDRLKKRHGKIEYVKFTDIYDSMKFPSYSITIRFSDGTIYILSPEYKSWYEDFRDYVKEEFLNLL